MNERAANDEAGGAAGRRVVVARGWTEDRTIEVPESALFGFHEAILMGEGPQSPIPKPMLGAILKCTDLPEGCEDFGPTCEEGECPHNIEVVVPRDRNAPEIYSELKSRVTR